MKRLMLVGAGGCGREVASMVRHLNQADPTWDILGFLDDNPAIEGQIVSGTVVLGPIEMLRDFPDAYCACCVAEPWTKMQLVERAGSLGARWATLVHHTAVVMDTASLGEGCILLPHSAVTTDACLGRHVHLNYHSAAGHDSYLGDYVTLSSFVDITGHVRLETGVFVGSGASVLPEKTVGEHAVVGAGAVVTKDIPPRAIVMGIPARVTRERQLLGPSEETATPHAASTPTSDGDSCR